MILPGARVTLTRSIAMTFSSDLREGPQSGGVTLCALSVVPFVEAKLPGDNSFSRSLLVQPIQHHLKRFRTSPRLESFQPTLFIRIAPVPIVPLQPLKQLLSRQFLRLAACETAFVLETRHGDQIFVRALSRAGLRFVFLPRFRGLPVASIRLAFRTRRQASLATLRALLGFFDCAARAAALCLTFMPRMSSTAALTTADFCSPPCP